MKVIGVLLVAACVAGSAFAHGGGLNADGCHNNRKTGDYHCHRGSSPAPAARPPSNPSSNALQQDFGSSSAGSARGSFRNCSEARAAGAAPVRRGDPGYGSHLDRDNDGIGCE